MVTSVQASVFRIKVFESPSGLHSKHKREREGRGGDRRGRLGRREGKGVLATKASLTFCHPHSKLVSKSCHLSLTCHVKMYNISRVNEAGSKQTFMCQQGRKIYPLNLLSYWETMQLWLQ